MKTSATLQIEDLLYKYTNKPGVFGCFEVTLGFYGRERIDYLTYSTKGVWRCYEVKVTKDDFFSGAHNSFVGHYNYFVLTQELYEQVREFIPYFVGVYVLKKKSLECCKKAKRIELKMEEQVLKDSMIRSLFRESDKLRKSKDMGVIEGFKRRIAKAERDYKNYYDKYRQLHREILSLFGSRWDKKDLTEEEEF